jgi:hypothetical protein
VRHLRPAGHSCSEKGRDRTAYGRRDVVLIFAARITRLAAYGLLSVVMVLYLAAPGLSEARIGLLLTLSDVLTSPDVML